jgi:hypothetical protein
MRSKFPDRAARASCRMNLHLQIGRGGFRVREAVPSFGVVPSQRRWDGSGCLQRPGPTLVITLDPGTELGAPGQNVGPSVVLAVALLHSTQVAVSSRFLTQS